MRKPLENRRSMVQELYLKLKQVGGLRLSRAKIHLQNLTMNHYDDYSLRELKKIIYYLEEKKRPFNSGLYHGNVMV